MYGKIFETMYDGTLAEDWRALVTFQQMIVLCDADGTIDMTPSAIARRTGIPIEHIKAGIEILENPDLNTRTEGSEGRRIERLDDHKPWGWYLVNHVKYKSLTDANDVRQKNRERKQRQRDAARNNASKNDQTGLEKRDMSHGVPPCPAKSRHTDTDTDKNTDTNTEKTPPPSSDDCDEVVQKPVQPADELIISLPAKGGDVFEIRSRMFERYRENYHTLDVLAQLRSINQYFEDSPHKRPNLHSYKTFISNWMNNRVGDIGRKAQTQAQPVEPIVTDDERARQNYFDKFGEWPEVEIPNEQENKLRVVNQ